MPDFYDILMLGLMILSGGIMSIANILLAAFYWHAFSFHWKNGIRYTSFLLLLKIPLSIMVWIKMVTDPGPEKGDLIAVIVIPIALISIVIELIWGVVIYGVAVSQWKWTIAGTGDVAGVSAQNSSGKPLIEDRTVFKFQRQQFLLSILGGLVFGSVSHLVMQYFGVGPGQWLDFIKPGFNLNALDGEPFLFPAMLLMFTAAAIHEELVFRGGILAYLLRRCRSRRGLQILGIILINTIWAVAHYANTDTFSIKFIQIFVLGIILTEITRRTRLLNAIAFHWALNMAAGTLGFYLV